MKIFKHMKKTILLALLIALGAASAVAQGGDIQVKGKIDGIKKGRLYLLARSSETATDTLGFCDFKRGKFVLKATATEPLMAQLVVEGFSGGFAFFAEPLEREGELLYTRRTAQRCLYSPHEDLCVDAGTHHRLAAALRCLACRT